MLILCPTCDKVLAVPEGYGGQLMRCNACQGSLTVPEDPDGPAPVARVAEAQPPPDLGNLSGDAPSPSRPALPDRTTALWNPASEPEPAPALPDNATSLYIPPEERQTTLHMGEEEAPEPAPSPDGMADIGAPGVFMAGPWEEAQAAGATQGGEGEGQSMLVACPSCSRPLAVPKAQAGMLFRCPFCAAGMGVEGPRQDRGEATLAVEPEAVSSRRHAQLDLTPLPEESETMGESAARAAAEQAEAQERARQRMAEVEEEIRQLRRAREAALMPEPEQSPDTPDGWVDMSEIDPAEERAARRQADAGGPAGAARRQYAGLQERSSALEAQLETSSGGREQRNRSRRGAAQRRLFRRLPGSGQVESLASLASDIGEALGVLGQEGENDRDREILSELQQIKTFMEQLLTEMVNDGSAVAERNHGEDIESMFRSERRAASASRPAVEHERERARPSDGRRGMTGPLRPSRIVSSAAEAGARAAAGGGPGGASLARILALIARAAAS